MTFGTDPDPAADPAPARDSFLSDLQDGNKNYLFSAYYSLKLHLLHFSKIKSHKEVKNSWTQARFFFLILLGDRWIRIRIQEAQKHTDPDPQHWPQLLQFTCVLLTEHHTKEAIVFYYVHIMFIANLKNESILTLKNF